MCCLIFSVHLDCIITCLLFWFALSVCVCLCVVAANIFSELKTVKNEEDIRQASW